MNDFNKYSNRENYFTNNNSKYIQKDIFEYLDEIKLLNIMRLSILAKYFR